MVRRQRERNAQRDVLWIWPLWMALLLTLMPVVLSSPMRAEAQAEPMTLTVQCRTVADMPVVGITVTVFDAASDAMLAEGRTDGAGLVRFRDMPPAEIRVGLAGALPSGAALQHTRQDQRGIWVNLPTRDWVMDLRIDTDGLVFPDLGLGNAGAPDAGDATAIAEGRLSTIDPTVLPTSSVSRALTSRAPGVATLPPAPRTVAPDAAGAPASDFTGIGLLVVLVGMIGGVVWISTRNRL